MRDLLPGLLVLTLLLAGPSARAADPSPEPGPAPAHTPSMLGHLPARDAPVLARSPDRDSRATAHPAPVHAAAGPAESGHSGAAQAGHVHPGAARSPAPPAAGHPGPAHSGARAGVAHRGGLHPVHPVPARPAPIRPPVAPPVAAVPAPVPAAPDKGSNTGLPLPRWSALRTEEVNLRTGPGTRYPIDWVYKRRDLPVRVEREFDIWRLVSLPDGTQGWVSGATLVTHRTFSVIGGAGAPGGATAERIMRASASEDAPVVARLRPGVIGRIRSCDAGAPWCQVQVGDYRGWLRRDAFWGTDPGEAVQ